MRDILQIVSPALSAVVNMSVTASVVIVFVLLARLALKKAPKIFSYVLWAVVLFRLLCPVSFTAGFSLLGLVDAPAAEVTPNTTIVEYIPAPSGDRTPVTPVNPGVTAPVVNPGTTPAPVDSVTPADPAPVTPAAPAVTVTDVLPLIWLLGIVGMAAYSVVSYVSLRRRLIGAVPLRENVWLADHIGSPFVMGFVRPKIYLPSALPEQERGYIILHEQHHIRRLDHVIKALAFAALCIHWFNPLVWLAFVLSSKDMEMSCDEAVVRQLGEEIRADYSASLLSLATGRRIIASTPLAFGEGDTGSRIRNMLSWKKPALWVTIAAAVICAAVVLAGAGNPAEGTGSHTDGPEDDPPVEGQGQFGSPEDLSYYVELAAGGEFRDMSLETRVGLLVEYEDLLDNYTLIARETADGKSGYIVGRYNGNPAESPLYGMYSIEHGVGEEDIRQLLYREADSAEVDAALAENRHPAVGYRLQDSRLLFSDSSMIFIQPLDSELFFDEPVSRYLYTPLGREYIADAVSRGVDLLGRTENYLYVYLISPEFGEIAERFALTEAEAEAILTEDDRVSMEPGCGFSAALHFRGETTYFNEAGTVPRSVYDLAVEKCGYTFATPADITGAIVDAALEMSDLDTTLHADKEQLPALEKMLKNAENGYIGACGYGAKLTITMDNGEQLVLFKGTDDCDSIAFGSYGGYFLGRPENVEFWKMFGLEPYAPHGRTEITGGGNYVFYHQGLEVAVTEVLSSRTEIGKDDAGNDRAYTVYTVTPGAELTVRDPNLSSESRPQWGLSYTGEQERTRITAETGTVPVTAGLEGVYHLESSTFVLKFEVAQPEDDAEVEIFGNGEVSIYVPVKYADLVRVDDIGSDNMYVVVANVYFRPEYYNHGEHVPALNGGWMLTLHTTSYESAAYTVWDSPAELCATTRWTADQRWVYQEIRPGEGYYKCSDENLRQFKAVLDSIRIEYGDLVPFEVNDTPPVEDPAPPVEEPTPPAVVNEPFTERALDGKSPLNGMFERTYETQLNLMQWDFERTNPLFLHENTFEFDECAVLLGSTRAADGASMSGAAYILFRSGEMFRLPLPLNQEGEPLRPASVRQPNAGALAYSVEAVGGVCHYVVDLTARTVSMGIGTAPVLPGPPVTSLPDAPPTDEDIRAALTANHAPLEPLHMVTASPANPFRTESWLVMAEDSTAVTHTFYLLTRHAVYDLLGSGTSTKYEAVADCCHPAMLTFLWKDGSWQVSEYWLPGDGAYYEADIRAVFPADAAEKLLGDTWPVYRNDVTGLCDDAAVRYYAQLTGRVPAKTFHPADVEFAGRTLYTGTDTMTYEARLAWAQAGTDNGNGPACTGRYVEADGCIAYEEMIVAGRYPDICWRIRFADGAVSGALPLPNAGGFDTALPEIMEFRDGSFVYEITFPTEELTNEGQTLIHLQGTYRYTVDLAARTVSLTVLPLE